MLLRLVVLAAALGWLGWVLQRMWRYLRAGERPRQAAVWRAAAGAVGLAVAWFVLLPLLERWLCPPTGLAVRINDPQNGAVVEVVTDEGGLGLLPVRGTASGLESDPDLAVLVLSRFLEPPRPGWWLSEPAQVTTGTWAAIVPLGSAVDPVSMGQPFELVAVIAPRANAPASQPISSIDDLEPRARSQPVHASVGGVGPAPTETSVPTATETEAPAATPTETGVPAATVTDTGVPTARPTATPTVARTPTSTVTPRPPTTVLILPARQAVPRGETVVAYVVVDAVADLYAVDVRLRFDASKLEVVDADGNAANGVQIEPGGFLDPAQGFTVRNVADNASGEAQYVFALTAPALPVSGTGVLARITFLGIAEGESDVTLASVMLSDAHAQSIPAVVEHGVIAVVAQ
jgi:hypothetical protein